jgi:hypothetical protein
MKYDATAILKCGDPSTFYGLEESRMTFQEEEEEDVHMPIVGYTIESRMTHLQEGEDDEDIPVIHNQDALVTPHASSITPSPPLVKHQESSAQLVTQEQSLQMQVQVNKWLVTHNCVKKLQQEVHAYLSELRCNIDESYTT